MKGTLESGQSDARSTGNGDTFHGSLGGRKEEGQSSCGCKWGVRGWKCPRTVGFFFFSFLKFNLTWLI